MARRARVTTRMGDRGETSLFGPGRVRKSDPRIEALAELDALVERLRERADVEGRFVVPGEDPASAALDLARTVARRAERSVVRLLDANAIGGEHLVPWLNRLSDVLFLLARALERRRTTARKATRQRGRDRKLASG